MLRKFNSIFKRNSSLSSLFSFNFSSKLYSNPQVSGFKKAFKYQQFSPNMTLKQISDLIGEKHDDVKQWASLIGIPPEDNYNMTFEEATVFTVDYGIRLFKGNDHKPKYMKRNPIITIMGHVDHGKTTLLDTIRNSRVAQGEYGGITQKIGAFQVKYEDKDITFIDTPGHEIFTKMRSRGASCTDMIILVIAANDGLQPQTYEVINLAQAYEVPMIIAINKIDMKAADPEKAETQLKDLGLNLEINGGNIPVVHISALKKINVDLLLELIAFETELLDLKADVSIPAEGMVLESKKCENDLKNSTIIVQNGIVKTNDLVLFNNFYNRAKDMVNDQGKFLTQLNPSDAAELKGLKEFPESGSRFIVLNDENTLKMIMRLRKFKQEHVLKESSALVSGSAVRLKFKNKREWRKFNSGKTSLLDDKLKETEEKILSNLEEIKANNPDDIDMIKACLKELETHREYCNSVLENKNPESIIKLMIRAGDKGTLEALKSQIEKVFQSYPDQKYTIISEGIGMLKEAEIEEASLYGCRIYGMDIPTTADLEKLAIQYEVPYKIHKILYALTDDLNLDIGNIMNHGKKKQIHKGLGVVQTIFTVNETKRSEITVAGIKVTGGIMNRKTVYSVSRAEKIVASDLVLHSFKVLKKDASAVKKGDECGISFVGFDDIRVGDTIECYELVDDVKESLEKNKVSITSAL